MAALRGGEWRHSRLNDKPRYNKLRRACQWRAREAAFKTFRLEAFSARWSREGSLIFVPRDVFAKRRRSPGVRGETPGRFSRMKDLLSLHNRLMGSWFEFCDVQASSMATISARLPMIAATAYGFGDKKANDETQNMVTEKLIAVSEGAQAGALESAKVAWKWMAGDSHPVAMAGHFMDVAAAATRPARIKVHANAKRLG
jgi:hypothetical protein